MEGQTIGLLEQCSVGCNMGVNSLEQVQEYIEERDFASLIAVYKSKHEELGREAAQLLKECGGKEEKPTPIAAAMSWITTEMKLMIKDDSNRIAKLMMDGCNMGIQSIAEAMNKYTEASSESKSLANRLVKTEEKFIKDLKKYL